MTEHKNIYSALCAAQQEFGSVQKGSVNPAFKSKYADLADVAGVVIPTLARHGVCVIHYPVGDERPAMRTEFIHGATETKVACDIPLIVDKNNMQGMKSATTYAKRIGLESLSGVAPEDDDGNAAAKAPPKEEAQQGPTDKQINHAITALSEATTLDALKNVWQALPNMLKEERRVMNAKDARKTEIELTTAEPDNADLGGDEIPL